MNKNYVTVRKAQDPKRNFAYLEISKIGTRLVEDADRRELDGRIQTHILEAAEAGHQRSTTLPSECQLQSSGVKNRTYLMT